MFLKHIFFATATGTSTTAAAMRQISAGEFLRHEDLLGWIVVITLGVMSIASWYFIVANAIRNLMVRQSADKIVNGFWAHSSTSEAIDELETLPRSEPFSRIALDVASAVTHHQQRMNHGGRLAQTLSKSDLIDRALRDVVARESLRLESGMTLLATVGSVSPFVGLLGTVWGIYHALIRISLSGSASMEAVAGPVGEALIMTAFGLFTAIPAVLAYNAFNRANRVTCARFDAFAHDLHDFFATGSRIDKRV